MPRYQHASDAGEGVSLENPYLKLEMRKRLTGWGWGEILTGRGEFVAVLDHLGELLLRDQEIPMRLEAESFRREDGPSGQRLIFPVKSLIMKDRLRGTSFEPWIHYPLGLHCMEGEVAITLDPARPLLRLSYRLVSKANQYARYIRGPWLKVGQDAFGAAKDDAILPGVEWLVGDEWSSGTDWFKDPWAMRAVPHPNKVAIPVMAVSRGGVGVGLAWEPNQHTTGWFNYRRHRPQPVFASPNFVDRRNNHLLGLMAPDVEVEARENQVWAEPPLELHLDQRVQFDAEVFLVDGDSLDVVVDWVKRHGLPQPEPRQAIPQILERIARAYDTHLWHPGEGWGTKQTPNAVGPHLPRFLPAYLERHPESPRAASLAAKADWCRQQPGCQEAPRRARRVRAPEEAARRGQELMAWQRADGSFPFDPDGRHWMKDDFVVARAYLEPMGAAGDTALDLCVTPVIELLDVAEAAADPDLRESARSAARRALEYCLPMQRPEGGDFWETPLHAPNLLAAGHAAVAFLLGYRAFGDDRYRAKAVHWLRALLPFTHLWDPAGLPMLYNTKPCLCSSDWYFANWVRDHVQWEVLETFCLSMQHGIDWAQVDPDLDWRRFQEGVTLAAARWMLDHTRRDWLPHNLPWTLDLYEQGLLDDCFPDTHNTTTGNYGGAAIMPDAIAVNLLGLLGSERGPDLLPVDGSRAA